MRWAGHVARMGERRVDYWILLEKSEGKCHLEDLGVDRGMLLNWIFEKLAEIYGLD